MPDDSVNIKVNLQGAQQAKAQADGLNQSLQQLKGQLSGQQNQPKPTTPDAEKETHAGHSAIGMRGLARAISIISPELGEFVHGLHVAEMALRGVNSIGTVFTETLGALVSGPMLAFAAVALVAGQVIAALANEFEYAKERVQHLYEWTDKLVEKNKELAEQGRRTGTSTVQALREAGLSPALQPEIEQAADKASRAAAVDPEAARKMAISLAHEKGLKPGGQLDVKDLTELLAVQAAPTSTGLPAGSFRQIVTQATGAGMTESAAIRMLATKSARSRAMALTGEARESIAGEMTVRQSREAAQQEFENTEGGKAARFKLEQAQLLFEQRKQEFDELPWLNTGGVEYWRRRSRRNDAEEYLRSVTSERHRQAEEFTRGNTGNTYINSNHYQAPDARTGPAPNAQPRP